MSPFLATLVYGSGVVGLFYLNRDKSVQTSKALWIAVIWFWILGSRPVSMWFDGGPVTQSADQLLEGSPIEGAIFQVLIIAGLVVVFQRRQVCFSVMASAWPIVLYFAYCLLSIMWSDFTWVSTKRWVKAIGDVVMALVVVTDAQPVAALRRVFSRVGFILLPASVLLIKYYPYLGRGYDTWTGAQWNTGVTTSKNILGVVTYALSAGALWQILQLWRQGSFPDRRRQLVAQCILLGSGLWLLSSANSATSTSCFILASILMLLASLPQFRGRPASIHALVLTLVLVGVAIKVTGADAAIVHALGRKADLTGRANDIWPLLIPMAPNALVGAGFESFWLGPRLQKVWDAFPNLYVNEAHNGYIEVYLNLGWIGVGLIIVMLVHGYHRSVSALRVDPELGSLMMAYVITSALYSYTEAGFRMLDFAWSFLLLAIIAAIRVSGLANESEETHYEHPEPAEWSPATIQTSECW
jgi:exopolysaccharide production protein ExoQ